MGEPDTDATPGKGSALLGGDPKVMLGLAKEAVQAERDTALHEVARAVEAAVEAGSLQDLDELAQLAFEAARESHPFGPEEGLHVLDEILRVLPVESSGAVLVRRASLWGYLQRYDRRTRDLRKAAAAYSAAGDLEGECRALTDLALPVGAEMSLSQRIEIGTQALEMARSLGRPDLTALCAANVAVTMLLAGDRSALALRRFLEAHPPTRADTPDCLITVRNWNNWATAAIAFGLHDEVETARRVLAVAPDSMRKRRMKVAEAVVHWRSGEWDAASRVCEFLLSGPLNPEDLAAVRVVQGAIDYQRHPMMKPNGVAAAADAVREEDPWGAIARAIVIDIRLDRREPRPARGLLPLVNRIKTMGIRVGWEDLLPAVARVSVEAYRQVVAIFGETGPLGVRARACLLAGDGLVALGVHSEGAGALLEEAAEAFREIGEPFPAARCLESAAEARNRAGRHAGDLWREAATTYRALGADRALASLLRRAHGTRALSDFSVPAAYRRAPSVGLTRREQQIADLARRGYTVGGIADSLTLSPHTVATHFKHIRQKLQVGSKHELVRLLSED